MADERDPKVSQRYRELGSEEPPPTLDRAILAASRRTADKPHAPLVTPAGRHRWYFSLGAAAIVMLAVAVTVHVERDRPDPESVVTARAPEAQKVEPAPVEQAKPEPKPQAAPSKPAPPVFTPDPPRARRDEARSGAADDGARAERAPAEPRAAPPSPTMSRKSAVAGLMETPERFLERIAELRKEGRHDEADKALEEFRKRYPDYRIPEAMLEKVEKK